MFAAASPAELTEQPQDKGSTAAEYPSCMLLILGRISSNGSLFMILFKKAWD